MDMYAKILASLANGEKTRSDLAAAIKLPPPKVAGALVTLISAEKVVAAGKVWSRGKEVTVYALAGKAAPKPAKKSVPEKVALEKTAPEKAAPEKPVTPYKALSEDAISKLKAPTKLYQVWGGYAPLETPPSKELASVQHTQS